MHSRFPCPALRRALRTCLLASIAVAAPAWATSDLLSAVGAPAPRSEASVPDLVTLGVVFNGRPDDEWAFLWRPPGQGALLDRDTLERFRVRFDPATVTRLDEREFVPLEPLHGVRWKIVEGTQELALTVDPSLLPETDVAYAQRPVLLPQAPNWGGFFNYALLGYGGAASSDPSRVSSSLSGSFEAAVFGPYGTGAATFIASPYASEGAPENRLVMLDANWRWDDPQRMRTLVVGDTISIPSWWGSATRFGGVQYSSNYSLQPNFVTYPLLAVAGVAAVPTTAELFSNNLRLGTQNLPAGPFNLSNVPALNGAGELQVVINNALGQQQVISQPFYVSPLMLAEGLSQFSFGAGAQRVNYGLTTAQYAGVVGSAVYRYGVTDRLSVEGHAEGDRDVQGAGIGVDYTVGVLGIVSAGVAASGGGQRVMAGFSRQASVLSFALRGTWATPSYREIGAGPVVTQRTSVASLQYALPERNGALGIAWTGNYYIDQGPPPDPSLGLPSRTGALNTLSASYTVTVGRYGALALSASRTSGVAAQTQVQLTYALPLGWATEAATTNASFGTTYTRDAGRGQWVGTADVSRALPVGQGFGYYAHAQTDRQFAGGASYAGPYGRYSLEASAAGGNNAVRGQVAGGLGWLGGEWFAAAPITESFALVKVGDVPDVRVMQENITVGSTGPRGTLLLPRVMAYQPVKISIDPTSVPGDYTLRQAEANLLSYYRSGTIVTFDAARERHALVRLSLGDGQPVPAGAMVRVVGRNGAVQVAEGGEVFLTDLQDQQEIEVRYRSRRCVLPIALAPEAAAVSDLGPYVCDVAPAAVSGVRP